MVSHLPDELLARRVAAGNLEEFEDLLRRYRKRVYSLCYRMAGNAEDAEDWAQECFVRVYCQLAHYDSRLPFTPWLLRVVSNTCINLAKVRTTRQGKIDMRLDEERESAEISADPMRLTLAGEETRRIQAEVASLPLQLRQAVALRIVDGLSFRELAEVLEVPMQTAASRVRRALIQIRQGLERAESEVQK